MERVHYDDRIGEFYHDACVGNGEVYPTGDYDHDPNTDERQRCSVCGKTIDGIEPDQD